MHKIEQDSVCDFGIASLVLAILAAIGCWVPVWSFAAVILAVLAIAFATVTVVKSDKKGLAIFAVLVGAIACFVSVAQSFNFINEMSDKIADLETTVDNMNGKNSDKLLEDSVKVEVGQFIGDEMSGYMIPVTVTNETDKSASFVIQVEMLDSNGERLNLEYVYTDVLEANEEGTYSAYGYFTDEDLQLFEGSTFKVYQVAMFEE